MHRLGLFCCSARLIHIHINICVGVMSILEKEELATLNHTRTHNMYTYEHIHYRIKNQNNNNTTLIITLTYREMLCLHHNRQPGDVDYSNHPHPFYRNYFVQKLLSTLSMSLGRWYRLD